MARSRSLHRDYCTLCGVRQERNGLSPGHPPAAGVLSWRHTVRAVCSEGTRAQPFLTGVGYLGGHQLVADDDDRVPYTDSAALLTPRRLSSDSNDRELSRSAFGFHDACWILLLSRMMPGREPTRDEKAAIAAQLYNVLFCLSGDRYRILNPIHDSGGPWRFRFRDFGVGTRYDGDLAEEEWEWLFEDPLQASVDSVPPQEWPTEELLKQDGKHSADIFGRIPREIVAAVLSELPSADLCRLRLASRATASVSSPGSLPKSFWHSRFRPDFEMGFYMAGSLPELSSRDWSVLYRQIQHCLTRPSDYPALCNRRRIWHVLGDLSITIAALLQGSPAKQASTSHAGLPSLRQGIVARIHSAPHQNPACPSTSFAFVWDSQKTFSPKPMPISDYIKVSTSFIHFDGRPFICGIRATTSTPAVTISQVGLIRPSTEQHFYLESGQKINRARVVGSGAGVVGVKFFIQARSENAESGAWQSVGVTSVPRADLRIAELEASGKILGLTLEFDACKCISIGILDSHEGREQETRTPSPLWFPDIPRDFQFSSTSQALDQDLGDEESKYCLDMDFGGPRGERLSLLNRITPFLDSLGLLRGMAFFYDDGTELVFGSRRVFESVRSSIICLEPSIEIRGSAGERIIRIDANIKVDDKDYFREPSCRPRFQIKTNMTFKSTFGMHRQDYSVPEGSLTVGYRGRIITRLFAQMTSYDGSVERLDARYMNDKTDMTSGNDVNSIVISSKHLKIASNLHRYCREGCSTGINLGRVKSIRFSRGDDGHCRSYDDVCGMLISFWNADSPLILGQWIREIEGTCIELQEGEKLTEISLWYTQVTPAGVGPRGANNYGRVAGICLATSKGQAREIRFVNTRRLLSVQYRDSPFEEMTGLVWNFNREWEFIQVLRVPTSGHTGTELVPLGYRMHKRTRTDSFRHNERDVHDLGKLFWRETHPETDVACDLVAIDAFIYRSSSTGGGPDGLVGLRFRYTHGVEREVGSCNASQSVRMESMELGDDEVIYFEREQVDRKIPDERSNEDDEDDEDRDNRDDHGYGMRLAFHFASGRIATLPAEVRGVSHEMRDLFVLGTEANLLDDKSIQIQLEGAEVEVHGHPPRSRCCVGLWVQMHRWSVASDWVTDLGPLFLCDE